ncbi:Lrp/AsnC family transcriptional regulator [Heyndrickxia ginsengihumi]|uniref:AsnC family transcriptional regulator n=1 Tax=Heyndrickxia ginsengihumi TaxID=363870 RepID=A0A0A6VA79_9BACI|nr:Lrp/AsnC family transcriptional regulator [Heyndrickxia ginsengihumi]KHD84471.1 AsnC family transcriptional regulator [Heyndrickxia ginsengihumi]MBE6185430.1 Lrp/AsnC family transcriptional regulator [Bacillus sp. (in: firmicutes)]MCM3023660.1 Lrp/AsnC family transcriptional regulator [Heyndrickxia ginsengihumi]NEY19825.1 Lrp/AsnC family transcriptional regulator [Heyndrickxia ginsengihumi]
MQSKQDDKHSIQLDEIDRHIIQLLNENGRISFTDLAKEIKLSRVAVQARINAMVENGVIERFTAVINPEKIGLLVSAFFNVEVEPKHLQQVADILAEDPAVSSLYHMTGPSKLHMHGLFKDNREMEKFLEERLYPLPGIMSVDCQILIKRYKSRIGMKL